MICTNRGCTDEATSLVPGYPDPLPKCFTHEREYVDRYGHEGVTPLIDTKDLTDDDEPEIEPYESDDAWSGGFAEDH